MNTLNMKTLFPILVIFVATFLSGCNLQAKRSLLDAKKGLTPIGDTFSVMGLDSAGNTEIDKKKNVSFLTFTYTPDRIFRSTPGPDGKRIQFTFHEIPGQSQIHLLQLQHPGKSSVGYAIGRRFGNSYGVRSLNPDDATIAVAKQNGVIVETKGYTKKIKSRADLLEVARLWTSIHEPKFASLSGFDIKLKIALTASDRKKMANAANSLSCLLLAGHREVDALKQLPEKHRKGVAMYAIQENRAQVACEAAVRNTPTNSLKYSLARVYSKKNNLPKMQAIIDELLAASYPLANLLQAETLINGRGKAKDVAAAKALLKKSITQGSASAMSYYAGQILSGTFGKVNHRAAQEILLFAAALKNPTAFLQLGNSQAFGRGVEVNKKKALEFYQVCVQMGDALCQYQAALAYYNGAGTKKDFKRAFELSNFAAENGLAAGSFMKGVMLARGDGQKKNFGAAIKEYRKAEKENYAPAKRELGRLIYFGLGTKSDKAKGLRLITAAAAQGDKTAKSLINTLTGKKKTTKFSLSYGGAAFDFASDVAVLPSGGFIGAGFTRSWGAGEHDGWLFKTDQQGGKLWNKTYGGSGMDLIKRIVLAPNGDIIASGVTKSKGSGHYDVWVQRLDSKGKILWEAAFGNEREESAEGLALLPDGTILIAGSTHPKHKKTRAAWLIKLDRNGRKMWDRTFSIDNYDEANVVAVRPNGNLVIAGTAAPKAYKTNQAWIYELDERGNVLKTKTFKGIKYRSIESVSIATDGSVFALGNTKRRGANDYDAWIVNLDRNWKVRWNKTLGGNKDDFIAGMSVLPTNEFAVAGYTSARAYGPSKVWVVKLNMLGQIVWESTFGGPGYHQAKRVRTIPGGGIIVAGWTGDGKKKNGLLLSYPASRMPTGKAKKRRLITTPEIERNCINAKRAKDRVIACAEIVQLRPQDPLAFLNRGKAHRANYRRKKAVADFTKAIQLKPNFADAYFHRAEANRWSRKKRAQALADYSKALQIDPGLVKIYLKRGLLYRLNKNYNLAIADLKKATNFASHDEKAFIQLALAYGGFGNADHAIINYTKAINISPSSRTALRNRGSQYRKIRLFEKSLADYTRAITLNPRDHRAFNGRAITYRDMGKFNRAVLDHNKAIEIKPNNATILKSRIETYEKEGRHGQAAFETGQMYELGKVVKRDFSKAKEWYEKAQKLESIDAIKALSRLTKKIRAQENATEFRREYAAAKLTSTQGNHKLAVQMFLALAQKGHAEAQHKLGHIYENGRGVNKSPEMAAKWFLTAAKQGVRTAQNDIGHIFEFGKGATKDIGKAISWYNKAAEQGHDQAQFSLGFIYSTGKSGTPKDNVLAAKWYQKSANQGNAKAQLFLGFQYNSGTGVLKNQAKAVVLFRKSAIQSDKFGQYQLAKSYEKGVGLAKNLSKAVYWYQKSAEQGYTRSQFKLGLAYSEGRGVNLDKSRAVYWYQKSAEQGHPLSQFNLALAYSNGRGVNLDKSKAVIWYRKAAMQGNSSAQLNLGFAYYKGIGVRKSRTEAIKWWKLAAAQGNASAKKNLAIVNK